MIVCFTLQGKVEEAVKGLGFERLGIYRPGLLITPEGREEKRFVHKSHKCIAIEIALCLSVRWFVGGLV